MRARRSGPTHRVTAVRDNIILRLDGRRAWDVFAEAAGQLAGDLPRALSFVFVGIPLTAGAERIERGKFCTCATSPARVPSMERSRLPIGRGLGDTIGFVLRDGERSRDELKATLGAMAARVARPPAFGSTSTASPAARVCTGCPITT